MLNLIGFLSGIAIIVTFYLTIFYFFTKRKNRKLNYSQETISELASQKDFRKIMAIVCTVIALFNIPFMVALASNFNTSFMSSGFILGSISSISLILTGLSVNKKYSLIHYISSYIFVISFIIGNIAWSLIAYSNNNPIGTIGLVLMLINIFITVSYAITQKFKFNGIIEIENMSVNCILLMLLTVSLILK